MKTLVLCTLLLVTQFINAASKAREAAPRLPTDLKIVDNIVFKQVGEKKLELMLFQPLVKKYDAAVVAISNDDTGISQDIDERFRIAKLIVERAADHGIKACDVVVDPLVMPIGAINQAGRDVFRLVRRLREATQGQAPVIK